MKHRLRWAILCVGFGLIFVGLISRAFYLQVYRHDHFRAISKNQLQRIIKLYPNRGNIYDRHHRPLALTEPGFSLYAIPVQIKDKPAFARAIAPIINEPVEKIEAAIRPQTQFAWIKRRVDLEVGKQLQEMKLSGLYFLDVKKRVYPRYGMASDVLGFVGIDNQGLAGLEYQFDSWLRGQVGSLIIEGDARGVRLITDPPKKSGLPYMDRHKMDGGHLITTLDETIQYSAQKHLRKAIQYYEAVKGQVVVMNPKTGDVLAMADFPGFNPNQWARSTDAAMKNSVVTDVYEPGSVFKIITIAAALDEKIVTPGTVLIVPETLQVKNRLIREAHKREEGQTDRQSVSDILVYSYNVGTTLLAQQLGEKAFYEYIRQFGFGKQTGIKLPGESRGILRPLSQWSGVDIAMVSFGQGIAVTPLQLASAASAIANGGVRYRPRIVSYMTDHEEQSLSAAPRENLGQIIRPETAQKVMGIMEEVVLRGTGDMVRIRGYRVGGKTGTAQKVREDGLGYEPGKYVASFLGVFPMSDPQYVILALVDSPKKAIYGSQVAGPIVRGVIEDIIRYKDIFPDAPEEMAATGNWKLARKQRLVVQ